MAILRRRAPSVRLRVIESQKMYHLARYSVVTVRPRPWNREIDQHAPLAAADEVAVDDQRVALAVLSAGARGGALTSGGK